MTASVLSGGGVTTLTNIANGTTTSTYYALAFGMGVTGVRGASLSIDSIAGGSVKIFMSNDTLSDAGSAQLDENLASAAQLATLTWVDRTPRYSPNGAASITGIQVTDFDTNMSYRFMKVDFTASNATNNLTLRYARN